MSILTRNFVARVFVTCFFGVHVPLIAAVVFQMVRSPSIDWTSLFVLTLATLAGTGFTLWRMRKEMQPVLNVSNALKTFARTRIATQVSVSTRDEVGSLAQSANWTMRTIDDLLREKDGEAQTDHLTSLRNRRGFKEAMAAKTPQPGFLAVIDIDTFKSINDSFGHDEGDRVLRDVAALLSSGIRAGDTIARWGGEEFIVHFAGAHPKEAFDILERLRLSVEKADILPGRPVTFSAGFASAGENFDEDFRRCDQSLYRAKRSGRNRIATDDPGLQDYADGLSGGRNVPPADRNAGSTA